VTETATDSGYVNYFDVLGVHEKAKPGEVRNSYRKRMKELVGEIARAEITEGARASYLLEMAKLNAALVVLRDTKRREEYWSDRKALIDCEQRWAAISDQGSDEADALRREYDSRLKDFLSKYLEELMLEAGRDKDCVEASHWDAAHERHASRILRHYRHQLYQEILKRLPFTEVTPPEIDWEDRKKVVTGLLSGKEN
jgi:curved DNA-binding protein CbpA